MKKLYELKNQRHGLLVEAQAALDTGKMEDYNAKMAEVTALNPQIEALEALDAENSRFGSGDTTPGILPGKRTDGDYLNAFFDAVVNGVTPKTGMGIEKYQPLYNALTEGGGTPEGADGGFLVPPEFSTLINEERRRLVALSQYFAVEDVKTNSGWRIADTAPTAGFDKVDEMGKIGTGDQPKFKKISYTLNKYALRVPVSNELLNDNTAGLMAYLARWFAKKGIITENGLLRTMLDKLTASNLTVGKEVAGLKSLLNKSLDPDISLSATIITNQSGFDFLDQQTDTNGRPLLQPDPTTGTPMIFKSRPVVMLSDAQLPNRVATTAGDTKGTYYPIYVGDFRQYGTLFRRQPLEVASTNIGGDAWITDSTEVRGIMRLGSEVIDEKAAVKREIFVA